MSAVVVSAELYLQLSYIYSRRDSLRNVFSLHADYFYLLSDFAYLDSCRNHGSKLYIRLFSRENFFKDSEQESSYGSFRISHACRAGGGRLEFRPYREYAYE